MNARDVFSHTAGLRSVHAKVPEETFYAVAVEAWSLFDEWMQNDPTCKTIEDPAERVRAICRIYGEHLKPEWLRMRGLLREPVRDE